MKQLILPHGVPTASTQVNVANFTNIDNLSDAVISLVSCDGLGGYDWSDQAEEGPNYALMAFSSSSSDSEVSNDSICSKSCLKTIESLKSQNDQLLKDLKKSELMVLGYKTGLKSVEEKLEVYKANESIYLQDIKGLKFEIHIGEIAIRELRKKLEIVQKEKDGIQLNVDKFEHASKSLNKLIECQIVDNCKKGLGYENYNAVPPPYTGNFMPPTPDLSFTGLDEFVNEPVVENCKAMSSEEEPKVVRKNDDAPIIEEWVSDDEEEDVSQPKTKKKTVRPSIVKKEFPKRKDTQVPQPSDPSENVADEAVHKELGDSLVRAATTASSLEAEQDNGNINKTQSKATPNESSSLGTTSGGGPRCQEIMRDTIAQTRFENVSKHSNDSLLARGNILRSDEDRLKLDELMALCTTLQNMILDLETTKTIQQNEIARQNENVVEEVVDAAQVSTAATTVTITIEEITLAQALEALKTSKPKDKGKGILIEPVKPIKKKDQISFDEETALNLQAQEQEELSIAEKATLFQQLLKKRRKHFAAKRAEEKRNKPPTKAQQKKIMCTYLKNMEGYKLNDLKLKDFDSIQEMFDRAFKRQKVEDDKETTELKQLMKIIPDKEKVAIDVIPLAVKSPSIVSWKIYKEGRKSYYQIMRADGKSQMYMFFSQMVKNFDRKDLEDLYKLVKANFESTKRVEDLDLLLWGDLKIMFEPHVEDAVWRNQQAYKVLD
ncbi:hypothetical protein Tco_1017617 [Tanacetum coccineum]|uniref:Uncharacterized protein n=1 Tax=Tanacetum coccineum TaxID=301880 RepID=A0ABQ5FRZ0_9ASTR